MRFLRNWNKYWSQRKINWEEKYTKTWNHPHRDLIVEALKTFFWVSLWEVGCASGPNLVKIAKSFVAKQLGGNDINPDAIEECRKNFKNAPFEVTPAHNMLLSDKSCDVILCDMTLIYVSPLKINKVIKEFKRVCRTRVCLVEFDSSKWYRRLWLRLTAGYSAYNYKKLLEKHGFYDIMKIRIPSQYYPEYSKVHDEFASLILARP
jgi:ubiquinone/menaquinone biosynthesis C-methylase UbiE